MKKTFLLSALSLVLITSSFAVKVQAADVPELYVGAAAVDVTPPIGTPLGGYGSIVRRMPGLLDWLNQYPYANFFAPSLGSLDPIRSKAVILKNSQRMTVFISLDVVGVTADLHDTLVAKLKPLGFDDVFVSAIHTHSGPGALSKSWVWEILAMDSFNQTVYNGFIAGVMESVQKAYAALEPADLYASSFMAPNLHANRRGHPGHMDNKANLLLAKARDGRWIGGIANYAIHGTILDETNRLFSSDAPGGIERALESALSLDIDQKHPTIAFINGAEGDVAPAYVSGAAGILQTGQEFAALAMASLTTARKIPPEWKVQQITTKLPMARVNLGKCGFDIGKDEVNMNLYIGAHALPRMALLSQIEIGDIFMMTWPGEPTTTSGQMTRDIATAHGKKDVWILGLTNGHMGYFVTPAEWTEGGYEPCVNLNGPTAVGKIVSAHGTILDTL